jgi:photoactive yellow protein
VCDSAPTEDPVAADDGKMSDQVSSPDSGTGSYSSGKKNRTTASQLPSFDAPQMGAQLSCMSDSELDALPFGVIEMDHQFKVLRYNSAESRHSRLPPDRVIGQNLFRDVAPWANNQRIARRYRLDSVDETMQYSVLLQMQQEAVTLRMLKPGYSERMYLLVNRS